MRLPPPRRSDEELIGGARELDDSGGAELVMPGIDHAEEVVDQASLHERRRLGPPMYCTRHCGEQVMTGLHARSTRRMSPGTIVTPMLWLDPLDRIRCFIPGSGT